MRRHRLLACLRISGVVLGAAICVAAAAAVTFGLGEATDFIFFRWWGIPRKTLFYLGGALIVLSFFPNPRLLLTNLPAVDFKQVFASKHPREPFARLAGVLVGQICIAAVVCIGTFFLNRRNLLGYIDGQYLLTLVRNQTEFMPSVFGFSTNPLEGLGDLWFFTNTRWIPELSIGRLFATAESQRIAIHTLAWLETFLGTFVFAAWLYGSAARAALAAWLALLVIAPITYPGLIYNITYDAPELGTLTVLPLLIVPLWVRIGRSTIGSDALCAAAIAVLLWVHFVAFSLFTALAYPFLALVGFVFLVTSWRNKHEFWAKITCAVGLVGGLTVSGLPQTLAGVTLDTAFHLFPEHLTPSAHELSDGSILLRFSQPVGVALSALALASAGWQIRFGNDTQRWFAGTTLALVAVIIGASAFYALAGSSGAKPIYYEYVLWPVYAVFASPVLMLLWIVAWQTFGKASRSAITESLQQRWPWLALPLVGVVILHGPNYLASATNERPNVYPPKLTQIVEYLRNEIALMPGAPFRGRVATMTGQNLSGGVTWDDMFGYDMQLIRSVGNDHRTIGLWYYNIPTLMEFSHTVPPLLYVVVARFLANNTDLQVRTLLNMRKRDVQVLRLLGVRYLVTDSEAPTPGTRRVAVMSVDDTGRILAVDEIPNPNLGVSPTMTAQVTSPEEALAWVAKPENDFTRIALIDEPNPGPLSPARDVDIRPDQHGLSVRAHSEGHSLLVIPFQFSHCVRVHSRLPGAPPELRRTNLLLSGLLFERAVDVTIGYRQGPFDNAGCRLKDLADDQRLLGIH
jgi:hypothetical protein